MGSSNDIQLPNDASALVTPQTETSASPSDPSNQSSLALIHHHSANNTATKEDPILDGICPLQISSSDTLSVAISNPALCILAEPHDCENLLLAPLDSGSNAQITIDISDLIKLLWSRTPMLEIHALMTQIL